MQRGYSYVCTVVVQLYPFACDKIREIHITESEKYTLRDKRNTHTRKQYEVYGYVCTVLVPVRLRYNPRNIYYRIREIYYRIREIHFKI